MKAFFSKIWAWIVGHKVASIIMSAVLVAGITCAIVLPITLKHEHNFGTELQSNETHHYYVCECGEKKDKTAHVFDKEIASSEYLKAEATATTKAQYYKSCVCGAKSATEYFETDKTIGTLANIQDLSKTYDKVELANPTYETNSDGAVTIEWYQGDTKLDAKPINAGTYKVKVIIAESATYTGISAEKEFTIAKVVVTIPTLEKEYDGYDEFEFVFEGPADEEIDCLVEIDNKNAGTYTDVAITYKSVSSENYEITATTVSATITPKTLNYLEITKVYDGEGVLAYELGTEHGVVAGDEVLFYCDEGTDYIVGTYGLIPENDPTSIDDPGADDRAILAGADKANYKFAERTEGKYKLCATITVTPKTINVTAELEYSGSEVRQIHAPAPSLSDVIDGDEVYIEITFDKAGVDATVLTGEDAPYLDGADADNYVLGTYSFSIVAKKLTLKAGEKIETTETYSTLKQHTISVSSNMFDGYVDTDAATLWITATLPSKNAGKYTEGVVLTPYVGNTAVVGTVSHNYDFSEVAATFTIKPLTVSLSSYVKVEYNGTSEFTLATPFDLTSANTGGGQDSVSDRDEVYITWIETSNADITDETFAIDYTLGGADAGNYDIDELGVEITKKKLTNLHLYITSDTYESGEITLIAKDGVVAGEVVKISITNYNSQDFGTEFSIFMDLADGTAPDEFRYETIALVTSGDYANYELATYDDGSGYQVVGIVEGVANCDVQYDGSCNCGTSHLTETLTFTEGEAVGKSATIACDSTYEGGIYKIALEGGEYEFFGTDQFFNISGIYDANGNKLYSSIGTYILPKGTYYFHVYVGSNPSSDYIWVKKTAEYCSFETARVFECQTDETDSFTLSEGDKLYLKIMGGENSKLNDFDISVPTGSAATFTLAVYGLDDTTEPSYVEETAKSSQYWDICDTSDFYVILTCVTAGDINVSAA